MTNTVPAPTILAAATMSTRRPTVTAHNSYAAVLAGQARSQLSPDGSNGFPGHATPNLSSPFATVGVNQQPTQPALVPSYLAESPYVERLASKNATVFNPPPTSALGYPAKSRPSHRGLAFDVIEHGPAAGESLNLLPSRWNENDKSQAIELFGNGSEIKFVGPSTAKVSDTEAAAIRADKPMPAQCGLFYYEVTITKGKEGLIGIGFCTEKFSLSKLPGWEAESWGYHGDDGNSFCCGARKHYGPTFSTDDVIGCGVNFRTNTAFFTKNGVSLEAAFRDINKGKLFPVVGLKKVGEHIRVNFGQDRFIFDIDHYMKMEKAQTYEEINRHSIAKLYPPFDETALIQALVSQYLAHDGYVDTARAFAEDVQNENRALDTSPGKSVVGSLDPKGDADAVNRQRIRAAILEGNVDYALEYTNTFYPNVLKDNELLYFRLRRRKLVEMIREVAETVHDGSVGYSKKSYNGTAAENGFDGDMDIDDPPHDGSEWGGMDVEEDDVKNALDAAVEYGQQLCVKFSSDTRPEIKKPLEEAFSLLAYTDPRSSVLAHLLDEDGRVADAEELNSAILVSLGKSSAAALERLVKQTSTLLQEISEKGGPGAFVNLRSDYLKDSGGSLS